MATGHLYYRIIYPRDRYVRDDTIHRWFAEARAANEIATDQCDAWSIPEMLMALEDAGAIRLPPGDFTDNPEPGSVQVRTYATRSAT